MVDTTPPRFHEILQRFSGILSEKDIQNILAIQNSPLPTGIRINPLKTEPEKAIQKLAEKYAWTVQPLPFCKNGWAIFEAGHPPGNTLEHRMGQYYLQDPSSMVPVSLFDINRADPLILDMAASPGGKTTHLIDRSLDKGFIIANDASKGRISALRSVISTWGGISQVVTNFPGESFGAWFPETFDIILLDAPCSMENLHFNAQHPLRETTVDERLRLQDRQIQLLSSGLGALKTGGQLVYATCSLAPEEDEAVVDALYSKFSGNFIIEDISNRFAFASPGITQFNHTSYHPNMANTLRLWPHLAGMSGFFCALLTKTNPIPISHEAPPSRVFSKTGFQYLNRKQKHLFLKQLIGNFGFDIEEVLVTYHLDLLQRYDQVFLIPDRYLKNFITLPYVYIGMPVARWLGDVVEPSHEFVSRFGHFFTKGTLTISDDKVEQWTAGRDIRHPETDLMPQGQYLLVVDQAGRNLGLGKLLPKRLRNMLPR